VRQTRPANRLAGETSPYLLQHAHNPVDWFPWGPEALEKARREDKPILLSIGYAACHWCHVMEEESFEDEATARLMNERFVPVKVDREERPDLDSIYMDAVQAMTGQGGWPMTVFLTPDGEPFYAGTYFPKEDRHGLPAFTRVLEGVAEAWGTRRADVGAQGRRVIAAIEQGGRAPESTDPLSEELLRRAYGGLQQAFDPSWGGFGRAPKFPQPMTLEFLLRCHLRGYPGSLDMVMTTLDRMAWGGIHDQVGGGFHRYSVDERWHVPHFEKMLYDNAQLARLYARAWQVTGRDRYRWVAERTLDYLLREMRHPEGGFFSSQDADSEGHEGEFYVWRWEELRQTIGVERASELGARPGGNWELGKNVLWVPDPEREDELALARDHLFEIRETRVRPGTDDKVLASWNGLAISALAEAGRIFGEARYVEAATGALRFVQANLVQEGRLRRSWREGRTSGLGYLDDHALVGLGALTVYETTFDDDAFVLARSLADDILELFRDSQGGGFFQTGADAESLVVRPKELFDNAVPSGNSASAELLLRLALLTGESEYERASVSSLRVVRDLSERAPAMLGHALGAMDLYVSRSKEVAIAGDREAPDTRALVSEIHRRFLPNAVLAVGPGEASSAVPLLRGRPRLDGRATAYVCEGFVCRQPVTDTGELAAQLAS
jgi:uncharacterized protein YyaL (SSP411 family)